MRTARDNGVPLSVLRGVRRPGQRWLATDTAMAMALTQYEQTLCSGCGHPLAEAMDPESEREWYSPPPARCHACTAVAMRAKEYQKPELNIQAPQALRFHAERHRRGSRTTTT